MELKNYNCLISFFQGDQARPGQGGQGGGAGGPGRK